WRFRGAGAPPFPSLAPAGNGNGQPRASGQMRGIGIVQRGSELLRQRARHYQLPREEDEAREVVAALREALARLERVHDFTKGVGLSAPQIGRSAAVAVVRSADLDAEPQVLINPRVVG